MSKIHEEALDTFPKQTEGTSKPNHQDGQPQTSSSSSSSTSSEEENKIQSQLTAENLKVLTSSQKKTQQKGGDSSDEEAIKRDYTRKETFASIRFGSLQSPLLNPLNPEEEDNERAVKKSFTMDELRNSFTSKANMEDFSDTPIELPKRVKTYSVKQSVRDFNRLKCLLSDAWPTLLYNLLPVLEEAIVLLFIGNQRESNASWFAAVGSFWINIMGYVFIYGYVAAQRMLTTPTRSDKESATSEKIFHQSIIFSLILSAILILFHFFSGDIFSGVGLGPQAVSDLQSYLLPASLGLVPYSLIQCFDNYFDYLGVTIAGSYSAVATFLASPLICWVLIGMLELGPAGAGWFYVVKQTLDLVIMLGIVRYSDKYYGFVRGRFRWPKWSSFTETMRVGLSSLITTILEWWSAEYFTLLAAFCGLSALVSHGICLVFVNITLMVANGFTAVTQVHLGQFISGFSKRDFFTICKLAPFVSFVVVFPLLLIMLAFRRLIPQVFGEDALPQTSELMLSAVIYTIFEVSAMIFSVIVRGLGKHREAFRARVATALFIGLPISLILGFGQPNEGIFGIWIGKMSASVACSAVFGIMMVRGNVKRKAEGFRRQVQSEFEETKNIGILVRVDELLERYLEKKRRDFCLFPGILPRIKKRADFRGRRIGQ